MSINQSAKNLTDFPVIPSSETNVILERNQISVIPATIGQVVNLRHLYLRNNKIKSIPPQIGNLKKLQLLFLTNNEIQELPKEIGQLTSLTQLRIENNKLTELPKEIGLLTQLTHLFLDNNQISSLPEEIKNLNNLIHLSLLGNPIILPKEYKANNVKETIEFILEQQSGLNTPESIITKKAYYFINASKQTVLEKYESLVQSFSKEKIVDFIKIITPNKIGSDTNVVFLIAPLDTHYDENLIFEIANKCKKSGVRFFILAQRGFIEGGFEFVNFSKGNIVEEALVKLNRKFSEEFKSFSSYEEFESLIFEALKQHKPEVRLTKLRLQNIGHFSELELSLDKNLTCLIGENGTGKSTILRAIALVLIGTDHKKIEEKTKRGFLKIQDFNENNFVYNLGRIRLDYSIDGDNFYNELTFHPKDNGNDILIDSSGDFQIVYNKYNLKSLIVGFPQARGAEPISNSDFIPTKLTLPHVSDLLPLVNNSDDFRIRSFSGWIANLYFDFIKSKEVNPKEEKLIDEVFNIISEITKKEMKFKTVTKVDPPEVWVTTQDSPNGIPLHLVSQGFKIIIGWLGYLLQRFVNTFPLTDPKSAFKENAIVIIDEVDISMHPVWQLSFIEILKETFPNTQFIFTTHDPLIIGGLLKEQVRVFHEQNGLIKVVEPETDPKGLGVAGILTSELFGLSSTLDEQTLATIKRRDELIYKQSEKKLADNEAIELNQIFHYLNSLGINTTDRDPLYEKFIIAAEKLDAFKKKSYTPEEMKEQNDIALKILTKILEEEREK